MPEKVRWGILSTANIGRKRVIPAIQQSKNGVVAAVASRDREKAQAFASEMGIPMAYGTYEDLLADPEIDAVYNPLPNSLHKEWSIRCAEAGKPVLCEKPAARDADEAQQMVDAFAERGLLFAEAFMYRFHPLAQKVLTLLHEGAVGDLQVVQAAFTFTIAGKANIRLSKPLAGGALMDVGCYCISMMRLMTGEETASGKAVANIGAQSGVDEALAAVLQFPSGVIGHFDCGLRSQRTHSYELRGTEGRIMVEQGFTVQPHEAPIIRWWQGERYEEITVPAANHYTLMAEDFAEALLTGRPPTFGAQDAVANMRVIDLLMASLP